MNFNASHASGGRCNLDDPFPFWEYERSPFNMPGFAPQNGMQDFLARSWSTSTLEGCTSSSQLINLPKLVCAPLCESEQSAEHIQASCNSQLSPSYVLDKCHAPSDLSPLIPKRNHTYFACNGYSPGSHQSTPRRLEELKTWLWMRQEQPFVFMKAGSCFHLKSWFEKHLECLRNLVKTASFKNWFKGRRRQKVIMQNAQVQAALSVASVAAAIAAVTARTADSASNERDAKLGLAVASAAALVAAQCADFAEDVGADHHAVTESMSSAGQIKFAEDIINLTASAASCSQTVRHTSKPQSEARIHAAVSPCERQNSPFGCNSVFDDSEAECHYSREVLARGSYFFVRYNKSELHWRFVRMLVDQRKQVVLKVQSKHWAGTISRTEKRLVVDMLLNVPAWAGRSLLYNGKERPYFGLVTSNGTIEFECKSAFDYQLWTDGISHLLTMTRQQGKK